MAFKIRYRYIRIPLIIILSCVIAVCLFMIGRKLFALRSEAAAFEELREEVSEGTHISDDHTVSTETTVTTAETTPQITTDSTTASSEPSTTENDALYQMIYGDPADLDENGILRIYSGLVSQNPDMVGWIEIPGFDKVIDYPVMQAADNAYYLYRDFYENDSYSGSIFMEMNNKPVWLDKNIVIYGHAMNDKSMFGNLKKYPETPEYYLNNDTIFLDLLDCRLEYKVISTYYADAADDYRQLSFVNDSSFLKFLEEIKSRSVYDFGIETNYTDHLLTLSTCNNERGRDARSVIHAKLVKAIRYIKPSGDEITADTAASEEKEIITANVYLSDLTIYYKLDSIEKKASLSPGFRAEKAAYETKLPKNTAIIYLDLEKSDPEAEISKITLNDKICNDNEISLTGTANTLKIYVTSNDKRYTRIYSVVITVS